MRYLLVLIVTLATAASGVAAAEENEAHPPELLTGADSEMLANTCAGCHGSDGASNGPAIPTISGLSKDYFVDTMKGYASGDIPATVMDRIAKGYSEKEITQLADYFAAKPFVKAQQTFNPELAAKGARLHEKYCEKCHGEKGSSTEDDSGILAGQWRTYLKWALTDFIHGDREAGRKMRKRLETVHTREGSAGIEALLEYYASQQQ